MRWSKKPDGHAAAFTICQYESGLRPAELSKDIHATRCLLVCADIANGSKHLSLIRPKVGGALSEATGLHLDTEKGIFQEFYYVSCTDPADEFHGWKFVPF